MSAAVTPFTLAIPQAELDDLKRRLQAVRWPEKELVDDWSQGAPLAHVQKLIAYWRDQYDWRRCEAMLNGFGQFKTEIEGVDIHFLHVKSPHPNAMPLILTHGWPGSIIEFHKAIGPLTDPVKYGGKAEDSFHVVIPSLPGYGFSGRPPTTGWGVRKFAELWSVLMPRLGYSRYCAQGGDWGSAVTTQLGLLYPKELVAVHVNLPIVLPPPPYENLSPEEAEMLAGLQRYDQWDAGYSKQQSTRPQTIGYSLADSPVGQAAWIYEKMWSWSDCKGDPLNVFTYDEMLDNIMLYWLPNNAASSARLYWESFNDGFIAAKMDCPIGYSVFPGEIYKAARSWAERCSTNLIHWGEPPRGGHFAAFEQPELLVDEIRTCFAKVR